MGVAQAPACESTSWGYDEAAADAAASTVRDVCARIAELLRTVPDEDLRRRPTAQRWSPLEYACHLRERVLMALRGEGGTAITMGRDERAVDDGYAAQDPNEVAVQVEQSARLFADLLDRLDRLGPDRWDLEVAYLFPEPSMRSLRWVAVHTAHEAVHHLADMGLPERHRAGSDDI
jgi:hypothetical protein